jgi:hypothetical protein
MAASLSDSPDPLLVAEAPVGPTIGVSVVGSATKSYL